MAMITVGSTGLPNPKEMTWSEFDLSSEAAGRNLKGEMLKDVVAKKQKIELKWGPLTSAQMNTIMGAISSAVYLSVTFPGPTGSATLTMYVGDRTSDVLKYVTSLEYWTGLSINFIQK